ncbi:MAG: class I SAM-dependent methyltransferase [Candidatus Thorarchaeota archaeon]
MKFTFLLPSQRKEISRIDPVGDYANVSINEPLWGRFWSVVYKGKNTDTILDYGCGPCWSWMSGQYFGHAVVPLEIESVVKRRLFDNFVGHFGAPRVSWDGKTMSFVSSAFDSVVAKASILKLKDTEFKDMMSELTRVTKPGGVWYIAPVYHYCRLVNKLNEEMSGEVISATENGGLLKTKDIKLVSWSWFNENVKVRIK